MSSLLPRDMALLARIDAMRAEQEARREDRAECVRPRHAWRAGRAGGTTGSGAGSNVALKRRGGEWHGGS